MHDLFPSVLNEPLEPVASPALMCNKTGIPSPRECIFDPEELVVVFIGIEAWSELCACANTGS